jgi:hypothetical protein
MIRRLDRLGAMPGTMVERVASFAEGQCGAVSLGQLSKAGLTERHVKAWVRGERIVGTAARTVFRMPGAEVTWRQDLWVAILAGPGGTVASHASAAALRGLLPPPQTPHVTVPRGTSGRFAGAVIHHATVPAADRCRFDRLPTTGVARAIVDCAALLDQDALDDLVDAALGRNLSTYRRVRAAWDRAGRVRGGRHLDAAIGPFSGSVRLGSEKEARVLRRFHHWGVPPPVCQYWICDDNGRFLARVDFAWPLRLFGLEYQGDEHHAPRRWGRDDRRLRRVEELGWRIEEADRGDMRPSATRLRTLLLDLLGHAAAA